VELSLRTEEKKFICLCFTYSVIVHAMTTQRAYALGYLIAGLIFAPLTAWAKASSDGAMFLYIAVLIAISEN
jgi:urea transporter